MKSAIEGLEPKLLWEHFYQVSQIPRCSKNEDAVGEYIISVAKKNNLEYQKDQDGNIIVRKKATPGYENKPAIVIQGHTDMVCEKNNDTVHDFSKDPIKLVRDGEWMKADGTTLGADNAIGFCCSLALMDMNDVEHPALEFLFTVDEETGLTGAENLTADFVKSRKLINLDSEEEGAFYIGCAGGQHTILRKKIEWTEIKSGSKIYKIKIGGLAGGHSGLNINDGLGNSIKLLSRVLFSLKDYQLVSINGGSKHNAIPREAEAVIAIPSQNESGLKKLISEMDETFKNEYQHTDAGVFLNAEPVSAAAKAFSDSFRKSLVNLLYAIPHGVMNMSGAVEGLVETSTNMAIVETKAELVEMLTSQRSSVATLIIDIAGKVKAIGELAGFEVEQGGGYPAWQPNPDSDLLKLSIRIYNDKYGKEPEVKAIHAGLECGIIGEKYSGMDMISFGPTIMGAHSPDEKVHIPAVESTWDLLLEMLKKIE